MLQKVSKAERGNVTLLACIAGRRKKHIRGSLVWSSRDFTMKLVMVIGRHGYWRTPGDWTCWYNCISILPAVGVTFRWEYIRALCCHIWLAVPPDCGVTCDKITLDSPPRGTASSHTIPQSISWERPKPEYCNLEGLRRPEITWHLPYAAAAGALFCIFHDCSAKHKSAFPAKTV